MNPVKRGQVVARKPSRRVKRRKWIKIARKTTKSERGERKRKKRREKHKSKKRRRLDFATDDNNGEEQHRSKNTRKRKAKTGSESASDWDESGSSESDDATKQKPEKLEHKTNRHFKKCSTLEKFDGTTPLSIFLNQLDTCANYNRWDVEDKASHLRVSLKGNAA